MKTMWLAYGAKLSGIALVLATLSWAAPPAFAQGSAAPASPQAPAAAAPATPSPAAPAMQAPTMQVPVAPAPAGAAATPSSAPAVSTPAAAPSPSLSAPPSPAIGEAALPRDLSPWGMFSSADILVKVVMIGLAFASVVTWTVWLAKSVELLMVKHATRKTLEVVSQARSLADALKLTSGKSNGVTRLLEAAAVEMRLSADTIDKEGIKERIGSRLDRLEAADARRITRGTNIIATIGATAPFVGLFGTVWGIMNSFIGISKSHTTNLAVVAPGIAEALLATAFGLFAAIPAVVIYNLFARSITGYRALLGDASAEVLRLASRDLDRPATLRRPHAAAAE
jgi:biopolymer transport protein ExbB